MSISGKRAVIISISSDIGTALANHWLGSNWRIAGTYNTKTAGLENLRRSGTDLVPCDLVSRTSVQNACKQLTSLIPQWDVLVLASGTMKPLGLFEKCSFEHWEQSLRVNFTGQLQCVHELLPFRSRSKDFLPCVLFFGGGPMNRAAKNVSSYGIAKIALFKMTELLDAEVPDCRFSILGPGWVKTKIHSEVLAAKKEAEENYRATIEKLNKDQFTPMEEVLDCCDWLVSANREVMSGRNFSVVFDAWKTQELEKQLIKDPDMFKLRRSGNNWNSTMNRKNDE